MDGSWLDWAARVNDAIKTAAIERDSPMQNGEIVIVTIGEDGTCKAHFEDALDLKYRALDDEE